MRTVVARTRERNGGSWGNQSFNVVIVNVRINASTERAANHARKIVHDGAARSRNLPGSFHHDGGFEIIPHYFPSVKHVTARFVE